MTPIPAAGFRILAGVVCFFLFGTALAIRPLSQIHDLVAGEGAEGFRDGPFYSGLFDDPQGLAVDPAGKNLYVADRNNNRIRVVKLDGSNAVETLAGTGSPGFADGSFEASSFFHPSDLVWLPGNRLVIFDSGNHVFRLLDLAAKTVSTLAGNGKPGCSDGGTREASLGKIRSLVYFTPEDSIYFTQPEDGALRKLDLKHGEISTPLRRDPRLPHPKALCAFQKFICVSENDRRGTDPVFLLDPTRLSDPAAGLGRTVGKGCRISALAVSGEWLYALQANAACPWVKFSLGSQGEPVSLGLRSIWGGSIQPRQNPSVPPLLSLGRNEPAGFVADPLEARRFFVASRYLGGILALKDHSFNELINGGSANSQGLMEFEYPPEKPPHTFRILILGSSYPFYQTGADGGRWGFKEYKANGNRMESMPKRLELMLNAEAALDDLPVHFEILNASTSGQAPFLELCYGAPELIRKYNIDLVLYVVTSSFTDIRRSCDLYFLRPLTRDEIPQSGQNTEYLLKPWKEKIKEPICREFYLNCLAKNWVHPSGSQLVFSSFERIFHDVKGRNQIKTIMNRPIGVFEKELEKIRKASGQRVGLLFCFVPVRDGGLSALRSEDLLEMSDFWRGIADSNRTPFLDLSGAFVALSETFWPIDEPGYGQHFNANGHFLFAYILAHQLLKEKIVPSLPPDTKQR